MCYLSLKFVLVNLFLLSIVSCSPICIISQSPVPTTLSLGFVSRFLKAPSLLLDSLYSAATGSVEMLCIYLSCLVFVLIPLYCPFEICLFAMSASTSNASVN